MAPTDNDPTDKDPVDDEAAQDRLDDIDDKIDEGREALEDHEPNEDEPQFIQDGSIRTDLIDDAIKPAS